MLPCDIAQVLREVLEERDSSRTAVHKDPALAVRQNLAFQQQFALFRLEARLFEDSGRALRGIENARNPCPVLPGPDHIGVDALPPNKRPSATVNDDGLSTPRFSGEQVQTRVEPYPEAVHYGIILDHQLVKHSIRL